jgi:Kef-type K+ transport system membrane component KefB
MNTWLQTVLCLGAMLGAAKFGGWLSARLGMPLVLGELVAGVLLGPTLLNLRAFSWFLPAARPGSFSMAVVYPLLAQVSVLLLMFLAGLETDLATLRGAVTPAFWAAAGGVILPMAGGCLLSRVFDVPWPEAIFIGTLLTATSVTITAQTLMSLQQLRSKAGSTILGAAVIDDVLGLMVLSAVIALTPRFASSEAIAWRSLLVPLVRMVICLATMVWLGPPVTRWAFRQAARLRGARAELGIGILLAFTLAMDAKWLGGLAAITGTYMAGLFVAMTPARAGITREIHPWINRFFGPMFFVSIGLEVNARQVGGGMVFFLLLLAVAILGKIAGCGGGALVCGFSRRESLVVGVGMVPRGEVGLITASLGLAAGLASQNMYSQMVLLVLLTTLITPVLLRFTFPGNPIESGVDSLGVVEIRQVDVRPPRRERVEPESSDFSTSA